MPRNAPASTSLSSAAQTNALPISLYFALEQGRKADMEVAARAAIAFAESVRELAKLFDPFGDVRVELASGSESSLGLNGLIRKLRGFPASHPGWFAFLVAIAVNVSGDVRSWTVGEVMNFMTGADAPKGVQHLSDADKEVIAKDVVSMLSNGVAKKSTRQIFREVQRDPAIVGVGVTAAPRRRPDYIVPRDQFPEASGEEGAVEVTTDTRTARERMRVTLKKLRLEAVVSSWRFQHGSLPEFSAEMKDKSFLQAFADDRIEFPLRIGIEMDIELESEQHFEGGVWTIKKRSVSKVFSPEARPSPLGLFPDQ